MKFSNLKKKVVTAALTALATMALGSGSVFAEVDLNGVIYDGNDREWLSGKIVVTGNTAIIDWQEFNLAVDSTLTIDMSNFNGAVLNRVTGNLPSIINGKLNQEGGNYPIILINPNGIVVGAGATFNTSNLLLSTLEISKEAFNNGYYTAKDNNSAGITFKGGQVSGGMFSAWGTSIEVEEGVTFTAASGTSVDFIAADIIGLRSNGEVISHTDNTLNFAGSLSGADKVRMIGHDVTFSGKIIVPDTADGDVSIIGAESVTVQGNNFHVENNETYGTVNITFTGKITCDATDINVVGGKTTVAGQLEGDNVVLWAAKYYSSDPAEEWEGITIESDNVLNIEQSATIEAVRRANDNSGDTGNVYLGGNANNNASSIIGSITNIGPTNNGFFILDEVSFQDGKDKANEILNNNADFASQKDSFVALAEALNKVDKTTDEKNSMVAGIVMTIADDENVKDSYALTHAVLSTFEGTSGDVEASDNAINVAASDNNMAPVEVGVSDVSAPIVVDEIQDVTISE